MSFVGSRAPDNEAGEYVTGHNPRELVIIQLGDLHFPEFKTVTTEVDSKDRATPGELAAALDLPIPVAIRKAVIAQLNESPGAVLAICGDITSRGDRDGFTEGLAYLATILDDPTLVHRPSEDRIHLVPGNHDVDFKGDSPFVAWDDVARFDVLAELCESAGLGDILTRSHRASTATLSSGGGVSLVSVNTCRGTGATRRELPAGRGDPVLAAALLHVEDPSALAGEIATMNPEVTLQETLDVPLLHPTEIEAISSAWAAADKRLVAVVLAHHGILPQHTPRLNPYTEMANAGQARRALAKLNRPVIYLHGHIHQHVVEVIDFPKSSDALPMHERTVVIAAPELKSGFNKVVVEFDPNGFPLGVRVEEFRISPGEQTVSREPDPVEVAITARPNLSAAQRAVLAYFVEHGAATGAELVALGAAWSPPLDSSEVESFVAAMCWTGILRRSSVAGTVFGRMGFVL